MIFERRAFFRGLDEALPLDLLRLVGLASYLLALYLCVALTRFALKKGSFVLAVSEGWRWLWTGGLFYSWPW